MTFEILLSAFSELKFVRDHLAAILFAVFAVFAASAAFVVISVGIRGKSPSVGDLA